MTYLYPEPTVEEKKKGFWWAGFWCGWFWGFIASAIMFVLFVNFMGF